LKKTISIPLYWKCQVIGWSIASFYWGYAAFIRADHFSFQLALLDFMADVVIGIGLTHSYRQIAKKAYQRKRTLTNLVISITPAIVILSLLYMVLIIVKLYFLRLLYIPGFTVSFNGYFIANWLTVFITGTRLLSIWVLAYHLYHYAKREIHTAKENARLSIIARDAQLNNLSAQLNPHFFFNSLNNIKFLISEKPEAARRAIDLLCDLMRNSLYSKGDQLVALTEELELVKDYLELEKMRFEERLQVNIEVGQGLANITIPPFSIQCLVENAIKHGIEKRKPGGCIEVKAERLSDHIKINVQNPGQLVREKQQGLGLQNLRERLQLQYNGKAAFSIEELSGERISATILISIA
jgi:sensor histidine kinase YesM